MVHLMCLALAIPAVSGVTSMSPLAQSTTSMRIWHSDPLQCPNPVLIVITSDFRATNIPPKPSPNPLHQICLGVIAILQRLFALSTATFAGGASDRVHLPRPTLRADR